MTQTNLRHQLDTDIAQWLCDCDGGANDAWPLYLSHASDLVKYLKAHGWNMRPNDMRTPTETVAAPANTTVAGPANTTVW